MGYQDWIVRHYLHENEIPNGGKNDQPVRNLVKCTNCTYRAEEQWRDGPRHFCTHWNDYTQAIGWCYVGKTDGPEPTAPASIGRPDPLKVRYLCDRKACGRGCTNSECRHTSDITHARNFASLGWGVWEEVDENRRSVRPAGLCEDCIYGDDRDGDEIFCRVCAIWKNCGGYCDLWERRK